MSFKNYFIYLLILLYNAGCTSNNEKQSTAKSDSCIKTDIIQFDVLADNTNKFISISDLTLDTNTIYNDTKGLQAVFNVKIASGAFDELTSSGNNSFFIDLKCVPDQGKAFTQKEEIFKSPNKKRYVHSHKDFFISRATERQLKVMIPYRLLEMPQGDQNLTIHIEVLPTKFKSDSSSLDMKQLDQISTKAVASLSIKLKVRAPALYKTKFTVHKFKLNTKVVNPEKFDFAMGGTGYPDLFWEIYCGNDYIYFSPVEKNKLEYNKKYFSPTFYTTKDDILNIAVVDYDNGPFNTQDDIIEKWNYKALELVNKPTDTLSFGKLDYWVYETQME